VALPDLGAVFVVDTTILDASPILVPKEAYPITDTPLEACPDILV
jgi:hypothetical protein